MGGLPVLQLNEEMLRGKADKEKPTNGEVLLARRSSKKKPTLQFYDSSQFRTKQDKTSTPRTIRDETVREPVERRKDSASERNRKQPVQERRMPNPPVKKTDNRLTRPNAQSRRSNYASSGARGGGGRNRRADPRLYDPTTNTKPSLTTSSKSVQPSAFLSMTDSTPKDSNKRAASRTGRPTESSSSRRATGSSRPRNAIDSSRSRSASIGHVKVDNRRECRGDRRGNPLPLVAAPKAHKDSSELLTRNFDQLVGALKQQKEQCTICYVSNLEKEKFDDFMKIIEQLKAEYKQIVLHDIVTTDKLACGNRLWKDVFHYVYKFFESSISANVNVKDDMKKKSHQERLMNFLHQVTEYYCPLIETIARKHDFDIDAITSGDYVQRHINIKHGSKKLLQDVTRKKVYATQCIFRMLIYLGDIHRYKFLLSKEQRVFIDAKKYFMSALHIEPRQGRTYHQLAILCTYAQRSYDAIYFYMRNLMCPKMAVMSGRENMLTLFNNALATYKKK